MEVVPPPEDVESKIAMVNGCGRVGTPNNFSRQWPSKVSLLVWELIWVVRA